MKKMKIFLLLIVAAVAIGSLAEAKGLFSDYTAVVVQEFKVPTSVAAPKTSGDELAEKLVYQLRRYAQKLGGFDMIIREGTAEVPAGKKVLLIKGEVREYTRPTVGRRIGRSFIPGGEYTGTAYFAAHYQFVDKASGQVIDETDLRTSSTGADDTVDYAMERNAEAAAKYIYKR